MDTFLFVSTMIGAVRPVSWASLRTLAGLYFHPGSPPRHARTGMREARRSAQELRRRISG